MLRTQSLYDLLQTAHDLDVTCTLLEPGLQGWVAALEHRRQVPSIKSQATERAATGKKGRYLEHIPLYELLQTAHDLDVTCTLLEPRLRGSVAALGVSTASAIDRVQGS